MLSPVYIHLTTLTTTKTTTTTTTKNADIDPKADIDLSTDQGLLLYHYISIYKIQSPLNLILLKLFFDFFYFFSNIDYIDNHNIFSMNPLVFLCLFLLYIKKIIEKSPKYHQKPFFTRIITNYYYYYYTHRHNIIDQDYSIVKNNEKRKSFMNHSKDLNFQFKFQC